MFKSLSLRFAGFACLVLSVFIALLLAYSPDLSSDPAPPIFGWIVLIAALFFGVFFLRISIGFIQDVYVWLTEDGQRIKYIHLDFDTAVPEQLLDMAKDIDNLGFTKLGVKALQKRNEKLSRSWLWTDETRTIVAHLFENVSGKPFMSFETEYADGYSVETTYNWQRRC